MELPASTPPGDRGLPERQGTPPQHSHLTPVLPGLASPLLYAVGTLACPLNVPSVQDAARAQTSSLEERLKELQEKSTAQVLQLQTALKDYMKGEGTRGTRGDRSTRSKGL